MLIHEREHLDHDQDHVPDGATTRWPGTSSAAIWLPDCATSSGIRRPCATGFKYETALANTRRTVDVQLLIRRSWVRSPQGPPNSLVVDVPFRPVQRLRGELYRLFTAVDSQTSGRNGLIVGLNTVTNHVFRSAGICGER